MRLMAQRFGKDVAYDRHCLHLSQSEIEQNLSQGVRYTTRLKVKTKCVYKLKDIITTDIKLNFY